MVRQNLADFLNEFFNLPHGDEWVWIEAVRINQSSIDGRSIQVANMRSLHTAAQSVTVWLGRAVENTEDAYKVGEKFVEPLCKILEEIRSFSKAFGSLDLQDPASLEHFGVPNPEKSWWEGYCDLHQRIWFRRK